ncbi:hypothetical protein DWG14_03697 [Streptomyces griseorubiginosus]|uniref:Lipoprotein n=2 Tax=Streptomyces TaxID=1883 RepID=A0AAI8L180_9ACTN|nr:hypothetical protein DWG14_03697 [Streptomyces griseorubiginosus]
MPDMPRPASHTGGSGHDIPAGQRGHPKLRVPNPPPGLAHTAPAPQPDPMPTRPHSHRARTALAPLTLLALLTLSGCNDGQGVRDEGPAKAGQAAVAPAENAKAARH